MGHDAPADAELPLVPRGDARARAPRGRWSRSAVAASPATWRWYRTGAGHRLRASRASPAAGILDLDRTAVSDRYEILRAGGGGAPDDADLRRRPVRQSGGPPSRQAAAGDDPVGAADRSRLDAGHAPAHGAPRPRELRPGGEAVITRLADILVIQAIRDVDRARPCCANRVAGRAPGPADRPRAGPHPSRPGAGVDRRRRWPTNWRCLARRSRRTSPSSSASPSCSYVARWRMHVAVAALRDEGATVAELRRSARLPVRGGVQPGVQARHRRAARGGEAEDRRVGGRRRGVSA